MIYDQDTIKVPVAKTPVPQQDTHYRRRKRDWMTVIRIVSLLVILLLLLNSVLTLFSYPNQLGAIFTPTPTPVHPQCAYGRYSVVAGTPIVYISEICK